MKTYVLKLSGENLNEYIKGNVSGIIDAIIGVPDKLYPIRQYPNSQCEIRFVATEGQYDAIMRAITKRYSGVIDYELIFRG